MIAAWKLPLIVSAIAISIVTGFYLGGPGLGMAVGFLAASSLVAMAVRNPPRPAIVPCRAADGRERLLLVLAGETEEEEVAAAASGLARNGEADEVLVLAPLRQRFLDRWACDTDRARAAAEELGERLAVPFLPLAGPVGPALRESPAAGCSAAGSRRRRRGARGRAAPASAAGRRRSR